MFGRFLVFCLFLVSFLTACGVPISYDPCATPAGCSKDAGQHNPPTDTDTAAVEDTMSCGDLTALATITCGTAGVVNVDCSALTFTCDTNSDGQASSGDVTITVTVNADGTVTVDDGNPATPDCNDGIDNDGDGKIDYPNDPGCASADGTTEVDGATDSGTDTGDTATSTGSFCQDWDADGYGNPGVCRETAASGYVEDNTDCNDSNSWVHPGATEYCNGSDDNCDGSIDNNDTDGDGYVSDDCTGYDGGDSTMIGTGDCADSIGSTGWINNALIHPGQLELGDWIDENCDGSDDDGCALACNSDSTRPTVDLYETDGDTAFECVDSFFNADQDPSGDANPLAAFTYDYDDGTTTSVAGNSAVSCENTTQSNPTSWDSAANLETEMCNRTSNIPLATCLALF